MISRDEIEAREQKVVAQIDGHFCYDWGGLAVSAWTCEYDCCSDFKKTRLGRIVNWFVVKRYNLGWWWTVGRHGKKGNYIDDSRKQTKEIKR